MWERDWTWAWVGRQGGNGMRLSCSGRGLQGQGSAPEFLLFLSVGGDLGTRIKGLLTTLLPASFSLPNLTPWLPWRPPSPASLSRCLFSSKESACSPQGPKLPHCHLGPCVAPMSPHLPLPLAWF